MTPVNMIGQDEISQKAGYQIIQLLYFIDD